MNVGLAILKVSGEVRDLFAIVSVGKVIVEPSEKELIRR